jgi:hypothetical protein
MPARTRSQTIYMYERDRALRERVIMEAGPYSLQEMMVVLVTHLRPAGRSSADRVDFRS